jgi:hypothetical protein
VPTTPFDLFLALFRSSSSGPSSPAGSSMHGTMNTEVKLATTKPYL